MKITDSTGKKITRWPVDLNAGEETIPVVMRVTPTVGTRFKSGASMLVEIQARLTGSMDPFVDIAGDGIDLSGFPVNEIIEFDVKAVASAEIVGRVRAVLSVAVTRSLQAGYLV